MKKAGIALVALGLLAGAYFAFVVRTPYGHQAVIWSVGGVNYEERQPGWSFVFRPFQSVYLMNVREQRYVTLNEEGKANAFVQSKDLQEITVRASLVYRVQPDQAAELYDQVGPEYAKAIIEPIFFDAIKEASGQRPALSFAEELASIANDIEAIVTLPLAERGIQVVSVALEDAVFDPDFILSVKEKVIADQEAAEQQRLVAAERAKLEQVKLQAEAQMARAEELGLTPAQYLELLWLDKWNGQLPGTVVGEGSDVLVNVP